MKKSDYLTLNDNAPFAIRMWFMRDKAGLTQQELADKLDCTRLTVRNWESGRTIPRIGQFVQMSKLFGVDALWLMGQNNGGN